MAKEPRKFEADKVGATSDGVDDDKQYLVTVKQSVHIDGDLWWHPNSLRITSSGRFLKALMDKPENADAGITVGAEV